VSSFELCGVDPACIVPLFGDSTESGLGGVRSSPYQLGDSERWYRGL